MKFDVSYQLNDEANWKFDITDECSRAVGDGEQKISATVNAGSGEMEVRRVGRAYRPNTSDPTAVFMNLAGDKSDGLANYLLDSNLDAQDIPGAGCPEPITCAECNSTPPRKYCGNMTNAGRVTLTPQAEFTRRSANIRLEDQWDPSDPFYDEERNTYCPASRAVWTWGPGFPATSNPEGDQVLKVDLDKLMGFTTRLSDRQRASCGEVTQKDGRKYVTYKRSLCADGKKEPSFIRGADYSKTTKTILLKNDRAPKMWTVKQTSRIKVTFKFRELTTSRLE
ncbi:MAG: hypothetical protein ACKOTH_07980 [Solirubrobacterales bacterium]